jgi:hypothetical protein
MNYTVSFVRPGRQVRGFVDAYIKSNNESLAMIRQRSKRPFTIIDSVLGYYDLPVELRYLAVIESELKITAVSRVGARGPWQLMAVTARDLGLKVNGRSDERTNYYKSTKAAALYLRDLHREFGDWLLVLAAYNAGPVPVNRAIHLAHSRNFWALQRFLPAESRGHVKRFIATAWYFNLKELMDNPTPGDLQCGQSGFPAEYAGTRGYVGKEGYVGATGYVAAGGYVGAGGYVAAGGYVEAEGYVGAGGYVRRGGYAEVAEFEQSGGFAQPGGVMRNPLLG